MNAGLMGKMFGPLVGDIMGKVAQDQQKFMVMAPSVPAPQMVVPKPAGEGGRGAGGGVPARASASQGKYFSDRARLRRRRPAGAPAHFCGAWVMAADRRTLTHHTVTGECPHERQPK